MRVRSDQNRLVNWTYFVVFASAVTSLIVLLNFPSTLRAIIVFGFLLFVPGWSFIRLLRMNNPIIEWTLAVALSLALNTLVAMLLLYANAWSAQVGVLLIVGISLIGSLLRVKEEPAFELQEEELSTLEFPPEKPGKSRKKGNSWIRK